MTDSDQLAMCVECRQHPVACQHCYDTLEAEQGGFSIELASLCEGCLAEMHRREMIVDADLPPAGPWNSEEEHE